MALGARGVLGRGLLVAALVAALLLGGCAAAGKGTCRAGDRTCSKAEGGWFSDMWSSVSSMFGGAAAEGGSTIVMDGVEIVMDEEDGMDKEAVAFVRDGMLPGVKAAIEKSQWKVGDMDMEIDDSNSGVTSEDLEALIARLPPDMRGVFEDALMQLEDVEEYGEEEEEDPIPRR